MTTPEPGLAPAPAPSPGPPLGRPPRPPALGAGPELVLSHGYSFLHNYLMSGEYRSASPQLLMAQPHSRVVVLHLSILAGGFLAKAVGAPEVTLLLLVVLKTAIDLKAHLAERRKLATSAPSGYVRADAE